MDRRTFITSTAAVAAAGSSVDVRSIFAAQGNRRIPGYSSLDAHPQPLATQSNDLTPYTGSWDDTRIRHLLRRAMFGVPYKQFESAKALGSMSAVVTKLLTTINPPPKPGDWVDKLYTLDRTITDPVEKQKDLQNKGIFNRYLQFSLEGWWFDLMLKENLSIREKMTMMWSNHFVVAFDGVNYSQFMYVYNQMLRKNALGNIRTFVYEMCTDPAMIIYLNSNQNTYQIKNGVEVNNINENFARELMELFTLGIFDPKTGNKNYTEEDIQEAAKALSGWQPTIQAPFVGNFIAGLHYNKNKTFFGKTGNWKLQDILNMIFEKDGGYSAAYFFCEKIYRTFVYWTPNTSVVDAMAKLLIESNWEIKPVISALLQSAHFYDDEVIGAQMKSPCELFCSVIREFDITIPAYDGGEPIDTGKTNPNGLKVYQDRNGTHSFLLAIMANNLGQELLNPPNVKGWAGAHSWMNTGTYPVRRSINFGALNYPNILNGTNPRFNFAKLTFDPMKWAQLIPNASTMKSAEISNALADAVLAFDLGPIESELIRSVISGGVPDIDFYLDPGKVAQCAQVIATLPEYHLC
jgi:uncharacterized protein (DUF1800 family)